MCESIIARCSCVLCSDVVCIFFCKQKTAYEMRISDWSSDVCSSDLHRGIFLPSVWSGLPQAEAFLAQLKRKAGLPADHWSETLRVFRYATESFAAGFREIA